MLQSATMQTNPIGREWSAMRKDQESAYKSKTTIHTDAVPTTAPERAEGHGGHAREHDAGSQQNQ